MRIGLATDNMDVFSAAISPRLNLSGIFPTIVNSANYGLLKQDANGKLFDITLAQAGETNIKHSLLIDDSEKNIELYIAKGGEAHHYVDLRKLNEVLAELLHTEAAAFAS
jgi:hypothetical protein